MGTPPEGHFEIDEPPRLWVEHSLAARIGDFSNSDETMRQFLAVYDWMPTLAALAAGSPRDRDCFVLAVAVLVDELLDASRLRLERSLQRCGFLELTPDRARSLARLRQEVAAEASTLGPALSGTMRNREWSRGESNPRPLECDSIPTPRHPATHAQKRRESQGFTVGRAPRRRRAWARVR
jgi:hypothetical protein